MKKICAILTVALLLLTLALPAFAEGNVATAKPAVKTAADTPVDTESAAGESGVDESPKTNFGFYPATLTETLPIMGMGMLGIFLVIGVIVLVVLLLGAISKKFDGKEE